MINAKIDIPWDAAVNCFVGPDDCHYESKSELMWYAVAQGCGCGDPSEGHKLLVDCLSQFSGDHPKPGIPAIQKIIEARPDVAAEFIAHFFDHIGLTEHGGSVYGSWLSPLGEQFIEIGPMGDK